MGLRAKKFLFFLLIKILLLVKDSCSDEILGCGGFIKSHADIDFSKVEIKLLTKQGSLKDKTDCSPSNGYYFIPVYDKGEYILKISPPPGWSFEPQTVEFNFNGKTDICSQGKDVNFVFKGFGITGKVAVGGHVGGAKDVNVELTSENGSDVRKTVTDVNGVFSFTPIIPGKYVIKASHNKWFFSKSEHNVVVKAGNTELPEDSLVVSGFDVQGKILGNEQLLHNIGVILFREKGSKLQSYCSKESLPGVTSNNPKYETSPICFTYAEKNGEFIFKGVASGQYLLKSTTRSDGVKLHIRPEFIEFHVKKDAIVLQNNFEVTGFSIPGRILSSTGGKGISGAKVLLNGVHSATTKEDGSYILENIKGGTYLVEVLFDDLEFKKESIKISLSNPQIPDIIASGFKTCGKVVSERSYVVGITNHGSDFHITATSSDQTGEWCAFLPNGKYVVEVITTQEDKSQGIQFFPIKQTVEIKSSPISGIIFSQLRATLNGEVKCLPQSSTGCADIEVTLHSLDSNGKLTGQKVTTTASEGKYKFTEILPGPYELRIPEGQLCWESNTVLININKATETAPPFIHKGYEISVISSHKATMEYTLRTRQKNVKPKPQKIILSPGVNTFCVDTAGEYTIELQGCHIYDYKSSSTFSTHDRTPLTVTAVAHKIGVRILTSESSAPIKLNIESKIGKQLVSPALEPQKVDGYYSYRYDTFLKPDETITVKPQSNIMLFKPESKDITGENDCVDIALTFKASKGLIIQGKIVPPIKDAQVQLNFPRNPELRALQIMSSGTGEFKFGPIDETLEVELTAEKESYVFSAFDKTKNIFQAHKLCEVIVVVKDDAGATLPGVLLSLSGAESYRKNLVTGDDGKIKFHSLSPSRYFLRPMMKEYKFNPNSQMIDVKDGETVTVKLTGNRVAYSAFGTITSLNGDPFPNVVMEAISNEKCMHHQEESSSENNGQYRIRGLQPGCTYVIQPKPGEVNVNVERSIPASRTIQINKQDVRKIDLVAISPIGFVDVIGRIYTNSNEHYKTLRVQMYRKGNADSPIYSQRVEGPLNVKAHFNPGVMVFFPRIPLDGKTYFVELKTSMSDRYYKLNLPVVQFTANTSSIYVELNYSPELKATESDLSQNSISALILVALVAIAFFKQDLAMDFLNFAWNRLSSIFQDILQSQTKKKDTRHTEAINYKEIEQIAEGINSIKKKKVKKI